ncbi:methyltransferase type 11 [Helicobacter sp. MIT 14-3879]|uniref:methyltransferase type 11 n=1 Tax=Helicobacter sp. MIT 14-3879 TaxID=2040649 RepID=UPI000E1EC3C5|nr:methyltransferase type 11 [Helicobacter sp. MIT 14-3879]RDU64083.1 methyltransferase type 11 [Helicobacter sp. MIT 14-3879]
MTNPWEHIPLSDYENHMRLDSVRQLQNLNQMMKEQFDTYPASSVMILGIAGGNGLEHIYKHNFQKVYGVDINESYLRAVEQRYGDISALCCVRCNLIKEANKLPKSELLIANLLIEYIGYECFQRVLRQTQARYVSCVIQSNANGGFISQSPYMPTFAKLDRVHHSIEEKGLIEALESAKYKLIAQRDNPLPNGKKLVRLDFQYEC